MWKGLLKAISNDFIVKKMSADDLDPSNNTSLYAKRILE